MTNREIKRKIVSVQETVKITKAMYSISVAKMIAAKGALSAAKEYLDVYRRISDAASASFTTASAFFAPALRPRFAGAADFFFAAGFCAGRSSGAFSATRA